MYSSYQLFVLLWLAFILLESDDCCSLNTFQETLHNEGSSQ